MNDKEFWDIIDNSIHTEPTSSVTLNAVNKVYKVTFMKVFGDSMTVGIFTSREKAEGCVKNITNKYPEELSDPDNDDFILIINEHMLDEVNNDYEQVLQ